MSRHNLTDSEWKTIRVFLPAERSGKQVVRGSLIGLLLMGFCLSYTRVLLGKIYRQNLANSKRYTIGFVVG